MNNSDIIGNQASNINKQIVNFKNFAGIINGKIIQHYISRKIDKIQIDSRKLIITPGNIFFAIKGKNHDSHKFLKEIYDKGIRQFVIEDKNFNITEFPEANIILVDSSIKALQRFAAYHRNQFKKPILGITGSNGKTIIKEWLSQALSLKYNVIKNPKSYNSQIGVPLSVLEINENHEYGIFEAGISMPNEMINLEKIIKPTLGIFTNLGSAHEKGFESDYIKAKEKAILFKSCDKIYYNKDSKIIDKILKELYNKSNTKSNTKLISWSTNLDLNYKIKYKKNSENTIIEINSKYNFILPFKDKVNLENATHCIIFLLNEFNDPTLIEKSIKFFKSIPMRLTLKKGVNGCHIIDDSYSNDIVSLKAALEFMEDQNLGLNNTLILSDFLQISNDKKEFYLKISDLLKSKNINKIIAIGKEISKYKSLFNEIDHAFYESTESFIKDDNIIFKNELILIKGARKFNFEKIVNKLQEKNHSTILEVDLNSIEHNLNYFRSKLDKRTKLMIMVKAFSYGSSGFEIPNLLQYHKVDYLGVAYTDEGVRLRENEIKIPIMVLNPKIDSFNLLLKYDLEPEIYSLKLLKAYTGFLENKTSRIHIKIDTGMHRLGFLENEIDEVLNVINKNSNIKVKSIFSHFSASEAEGHDKFTNQQALLFSKISNKIEKYLGYKTLKHLLNSSGILRFPKYQLDMVRLGIGLYGVGVGQEFISNLEASSCLSTIISQIKSLPKGSTIGYNRKGILKRDSKIAVIAVGYADGFSRIMGNGKCNVLINNELAPIIGNICMDMCMIDVTDIKNVEEGDRVIIFGKKHSIDELADSSGTISYEILTQISERVKREYIYS